MADEKPKSAPGPKVSPARTIASLILLLIVGVICAIELRAGFGQMMSGKSLAAKAKDGEFTDLSLEEARGLLSLAPKETKEDRGPDSYYHYEWYSLLRPLMGQQNPKLTIVATNEEKPMAMAFIATDEPDVVLSPDAKDSGAGAAPPGMIGGMGGGMGMGMGGMRPGGGPGGNGPDGNGPGGGLSSRPPLEEQPESSEAPAPAETSAPAEPPTGEAPADAAPSPEAPAPAAAN